MDKITKIEFKTLSEEERNSLRKVYINLDKIWEFQCKVNQNLMVYLFGEQLGKHYWGKFTREHDRNIMKMMKAMDSDKKGDMIANIFLDDNLYAHV